MTEVKTENLLSEQYRPTELDDLSLPEMTKLKFEEYIENEQIPNLLFYGPYGSGKSTCARILIDKIIKEDSDLLVMNGSSKTGIDNIRNNIESFVKIPAYGGSRNRIVFIEEANRLSKEAQESLKATLDEFYENARFIFTTNHIKQMDGGLISRCNEYKFEKMPVEKIKEILDNILKCEGIDYDEPTIDSIIKAYYPDIRKIINVIEQNVVDFKLKPIADLIAGTEREILNKVYKMLYHLNKKEFDNVKECILQVEKLISGTDVDYISLYTEVFNDKKTPIWFRMIMSESADRQFESMVPQMHFLATLYKVIKERCSDFFKEVN